MANGTKSKIVSVLRNKVGDVLRLYPPAHKFALFLERILKIPPSLLKINFLVIQQHVGGKTKIIIPEDATYNADGFTTNHFVAFLNDRKLSDAYKEALAFTDPNLTKKWSALDIRWRAHIATWAAKQAARLDGDFIECGVWYGFLSKTICEYIDFELLTNKTFYLVDTWGDPNKKELNHRGYPDDVFDIVNERFKAYSNVKLIRGFIPNVLERITVEKIAYLSIDMNGDFAERKTLEKYYDLMVKGGIIYFDDYGWDYPKLRQTVDDFFKDKPESLLHFPSGNSIVVKL